MASMILDPTDCAVTARNAAVRRVLPGMPDDGHPFDLMTLVHPDDAEKLRSAVRDCGMDPGQPRYVRLRFVGPASCCLPTEAVVVGVVEGHEHAPRVLLQFRDATSDRSLTVLLRLLADDPDGTTLARALAQGALARLSVKVLTLNRVDHDAGVLVQVASYGMSREMDRAYAVMPLEASHPVGATVLNAETIELAVNSIDRRFPIVATAARSQPWFDTGHVLSMPIISRGIVIGALLAISDNPVPRSWSARESLGNVCQSLAPWVLLRMGERESAAPRVSRTSPLTLSDRERTILRLVGEGRKNSEIAYELGYSDATVRADLGRLSKILGVHGRREVVQRAQELGL